MGPWSMTPDRFSRSKFGETDLDKLIDYLDMEIEIFTNRQQKRPHDGTAHASI